MVDLSGLEPLTSAMQKRRSSQLNYRPLFICGRAWTRTTDLRFIRAMLQPSELRAPYSFLNTNNFFLIGVNLEETSF